MRFFLLPLAWLYSVVIAVRNKLFDSDVLKRRKFNIPVITVGNITMCGTGKTPHTEYLMALLKDSCKLAVLSRGYMRKTKGYVLANGKTTTEDIGDEPFQMHQKFPDVDIAVCEDRCHGIERLIEEEHTECVILDDAYQHRYVEPGLNILLIDYNRPLSKDHLIPAGLLREPPSAKKRADVIIVTKCPAQMSTIDFRVMTNEIRPLAFQKLFFSTNEYQPLQPLFNREAANIPLNDIAGKNVLLLTAIGSTHALTADLTRYEAKIRHLSFRDHHQFDNKDIYSINEQFALMPQPKIIITTEKDATRLINTNGLSPEASAATYVLPIKVRILLDQQEKFNSLIRDFVHKDSKSLSAPQPLSSPKTVLIPPSDNLPQQSFANADEPQGKTEDSPQSFVISNTSEQDPLNRGVKPETIEEDIPATIIFKEDN